MLRLLMLLPALTPMLLPIAGCVHARVTPAEQSSSPWTAQRAGPIDVAADDPVIGTPNAPMTVLVWSDFECPWCSRANDPLVSYVLAHPDTRLVAKHYPLSSECNPNVGTPMHPAACTAARAGICAAEQGRFDAASAYLFAQGGQLLDPSDFTAKVQLDPQQWGACFSAPTTTAKLERDIAQGRKAGVRGTPSIYMYGPWGDHWVHISGGPPEVAAAFDAARRGEKLPPPLSPER
jgi:protein-disulfide isomerase